MAGTIMHSQQNIAELQSNYMPLEVFGIISNPPATINNISVSEPQSMNVPEVSLILTDSQRNHLRENVNPLQESAYYGIDSMRILNNLLSVLQNFQSCMFCHILVFKWKLQCGSLV